MTNPGVLYIAHTKRYDAISPPNTVAYATCQGALTSLVNSLCKELSPQKVSLCADFVSLSRDGNELLKIVDVVIYEVTTGHGTVWVKEDDHWVSPYAIHAFMNVSTKTILECLRS